MAGTWLAQLSQVVRRAVRAAPATPGTSPPGTSAPGRLGSETVPGGGAAQGSGPRPYPGDFTGVPPVSYDPHPGELADPGEVVWTWVPYEEDHAQGKDRPVLVVGRDGDWLLALPMTSKDHDRDLAQEAHEGRFWCDVGSGPWDPRGRPSEVRVDRVVRVDPARVRRIGATLGRDRFLEVAGHVRAGR